jgi:uncharacterized protein (DUF2236 family)
MALEIRKLSDIAGESALVAGGGRAILLQLANPGVGKGVAEHSDFVFHPLDRLTATLTYVYAIVYGSPEEVALVRRRVNEAHGPVHSAADGEAPRYNAFDPALQLWVVATLFDTAITLHTRIFGQLEPSAADRIYQEYAVIGTSLQVPIELWPPDRESFKRYWDAQQSNLRVDDVTRRVAYQLLHPTNIPWWLQLAMPLGRLITAGLLSDDLRSQYQLSWGARDQRRFERIFSVAAFVVPRLPRRIRFVLRDRYLRSLRKEVAANAGRAPQH